MDLLKLLLVSVVAWSLLRSHLPEIVSMGRVSADRMFALGGSLLYSVGLRIGGVLLLLGLIDYAHQRYDREKNLRMSKQDVKDEMRRMEGDPKIKLRRRQIAQQAAQQQLSKDVSRAAVLIIDETRCAVALQYTAAMAGPPRVTARGQGDIADRMRDIAAEHGVAIVERKPLARDLHKRSVTGQNVPEAFHSTVAEILAYVHELNGTAGRRTALRDGEA